MTRRLFAILALLPLLLLAGRADASDAYLAVAGPGDDVYEVFGHDAIIINDADTQEIVAYNWGVFDFNQPNFIGRFVAGRMLYTMRGEPDGFGYMVREYKARQRTFRIYPLNLSPVQVARLQRLCEKNNTPGHQDYRYDYYRDNCSTRVRDMIDAATDGQVAAQLKGKSTGHTLRYFTDALSQRVPWLYVGLQYVLGHTVDQPIDAWAEGFLPDRLQAHLADLTVTWEDGSRHALLGPVREYVPDTRGPLIPPPVWWYWFLLAGVVWGGGIVGLTTFGVGRRWLAPIPILAWGLLCLVGGGICTFAWFFTDHVAAGNNENWLQLSPLELPMFLAAILLLFNRRPRWIFWAAVVPLALSVLGLAAKVLPFMHQPNASIILLALPIHLGIAVATHRCYLRKTP